jgi:hypothetical protein
VFDFSVPGQHSEFQCVDYESVCLICKALMHTKHK